jgi:glyoxylase-like metal-dependent hydrolase (beta-lactamase superfamily II)
VTIVKYGTLSTRKNNVYLNYPLYHEDDDEIRMDYFFWILENDERTVVVDTGFSRHGGDVRGRTTVRDVAELLARFGVQPDKSPDVIVTHAHYDHIGNLDLFPSSRVFLASREFEFWNSRHAHRALFHHSVEDIEIRHLNQVHREGRLNLFEQSVEVAPGVIVEVVGGHTPGQAVVKVNTDEGVVLLASDAIHFYEEYDRDWLFMSVADLVEMYEGFDFVRDLLQSGAVTHLVAGHDPSTLSRFTPVEGEFSDLAATIGTLAKVPS